MGKFVPSDWTPIGGFAIRTQDMMEATKIYAQIDGLTGTAKEGRHEGVDWMLYDNFREKVIEVAQQRKD